MSYYCHITPGRLRIKTPVIKQNPGEIDRVREILESLSGVDAVSINALTGSITINHSGCAADSDWILNILKEKGYYKISSIDEQEHPIQAVASRFGATLGKAIVGAAVEKALEGLMLSLLAFLV